jgi:hypothetical protein
VRRSSPTRPAAAPCGGARPHGRSWLPRGGARLDAGGGSARRISRPARRRSPACSGDCGPCATELARMLGQRPARRSSPARPTVAGLAPARGRSPRCRLWPLRGGGLLDAGSAPARRLTCTAGRGPWLGRGEKMKRTVVTSPLKNTRSSYHSVVTLPNRSKLHYITQASASLAPDSSQAKVSQVAKHPPIVTWAATLCVVGLCTHPHVSQVRQPDTTSERN